MILLMLVALLFVLPMLYVFGKLSFGLALVLVALTFVGLGLVAL